MRLDQTPEQSSDIRTLLEENRQYLKEILASTQKTRRYILWGQVFSMLKILIIVVPLVLGFLYVQPYLRSALSSYQSLFGQGTPDNTLNLGGSDLLKQFQDLQRSGQMPSTNKPSR